MSTRTIMSVKTAAPASVNDKFFRSPPPPPMPTRRVPLPETTPLGDSDCNPKIQLCLELRSKEIPTAPGRKVLKSFSNNSKKTEQNFLEVTVLWVKNLPIDGPKRPNPCVKLRLTPQDDLHITELKADRSDAQYIEVFTFPLRPASNLKGSSLEVLVCENKATRNAKQHGAVIVPLDSLEMGKPETKWYHLTKPSNAQTGQDLNKTSTPKPKKRSESRRPLPVVQEKETKENVAIPFSQLSIS